MAGHIKPLTTHDMHTFILLITRGFSCGSCDGPGYALRARYSSGFTARGEIGRAARPDLLIVTRQIVPHRRAPLHETSPAGGGAS